PGSEEPQRQFGALRRPHRADHHLGAKAPAHCPGFWGYLPACGGAVVRRSSFSRWAAQVLAAWVNSSSLSLGAGGPGLTGEFRLIRSWKAKRISDPRLTCPSTVSAAVMLPVMNLREAPPTSTRETVPWSTVSLWGSTLRPLACKAREISSCNNAWKVSGATPRAACTRKGERA